MPETGIDDRSNPPAPEGGITINELLVRCLTFAQTYYSDECQPTKVYVEMVHAVRPLKGIYGTLPAAELGPLKLKAVRENMVEVRKLSRPVTNRRVGRIKRVFKSAVSEELVPPSVFQGLLTVTGLRRGRSTARETDPVLTGQTYYRWRKRYGRLRTDRSTST